MSQQLEDFKKKWIGKKVYIKDKSHPHFDETGEVIDVRNTFAGMGMEIKGEWESFFVFRGDQITVLR